MKNQKSYTINTPEITEKEVKDALRLAIRQTESCLEPLSGRFKHIFSDHNFYRAAPNDQWTNGFWTGELWLAYENTGNKAFAKEALIHVDSFLDRIVKEIETDTHDLGFLYSPSCVAGYKLTGSQTAKQAALLAAD